MDSLFTSKNIKMNYGRFTLDIPDFDIARGERFCLMGHNGAGKSTLLKIISLLETPEQGELFFDNKPVAPDNIKDIRKQVTLVFSEPVLYRGTAYDNVMLGLKLRKIPNAEATGRVNDALSLFGIGHLASADVANLSSGERQRVNLARALAINPELLLLDEPTISLDPPSRERLFDDIRRILAEQKITTLLVTQLRDEAIAFGQRIGIMIDGRIAQSGTTDQVFNSPVSHQVAEFVGMNTIIDGKVVSYQNGISLVRVKGNNIISVHSAQLMPEGQAVVLGIRPEEVLLMARDIDNQSLSARNKFRAKVLQMTPREGQYKVSVECSGDDNQAGFILNSLVTPSAVKDLGIDIGKILIAVFKANAVHIIKR